MNNNIQVDLLAIGELLADLITESYVSDLSEATRFSIHQGGSPANVCANLCWLGHSTRLIAAVGTDGLGKMMIQQLQELGLETETIQLSSLPTSLVLVGRSTGTPDFIPYRLADTQITAVPTEWITQSRILHTSSFALSRNPARKNILEAFHKGKQSGKQLSVDWNYAPTVWGNESAAEVWKELSELEVLLKISQDDLERFTNTPFHVTQAHEFLNGFQARMICLTCGKDGVWFRNQSGGWNFLPAIPVDEVRDTTGAGDAFWAGFLHEWLKSEDEYESVKSGLALANKKIQLVGPLYQKI